MASKSTIEYGVPYRTVEDELEAELHRAAQKPEARWQRFFRSTRYLVTAGVILFTMGYNATIVNEWWMYTIVGVMVAAVVLLEVGTRILKWKLRRMEEEARRVRR